MERDVLRRQVDRILSTTDTEICSVIIHLAVSDEERDALGRSAAQAIGRRALALTARDCLPAQRESAQQTIATPRPWIRADPDALIGSLSVQMATDVPAQATAPGIDDTRERVLGRIRRLLDNDYVRRTLDQTERGTDENAAGRLWAADAVCLDLPTQALRRLPEEVDGIGGIYPNRRVQVPPVVRAANLPPQVLENRASSWGVERVGALAAWGAYGARGAGVTVGVLDTGVDPAHPDLVGKISGFAEFGTGGAVTGAVAHDPIGHGTHVCGTVVGGNTSGQWVGVAPEARLAVGKVLDDRGGSDAQVLAGITWAIEQRVDVISLSVGDLVLQPQPPPTFTVALLTALRHGIPTVVSIGNEGSQTTGLPGNDLYALSVGAIDHLNQPAGFSGGRTQVLQESDFIDQRFLPIPYSKPEVCAPGVAVVSTIPGGTWAPLNGTSMAAPHAAGVIALLLSATGIRENVSPVQRGFLIQDLLAGSVDELGESGQDHRYGFGLVNALKAIGFARERGF